MPILWLSFVALVTLIACQAVVLTLLLRETAWWKRLLDFEEPGNQLPTGSLLPPLKAQPLEEPDGLSDGLLDSLGTRPTTLVFVTPRDQHPKFDALLSAIHVMWHKTNGALFMVCSGARAQCETFIEPYGMAFSHMGHSLRALVDETGDDAKNCRVSTTPGAIEVDEQGRVLRCGSPAPDSVSVIELRSMEATR